VLIQGTQCIEFREEGGDGSEVRFMELTSITCCPAAPWGWYIGKSWVLSIGKLGVFVWKSMNMAGRRGFLGTFESKMPLFIHWSVDFTVRY
jgi:hypothetical protein